MFPDKIIVKITDSLTKEPISNCAIMIILFARHKNDYHMIPNLSDVSGTIIMNKEWVKSQIHKDRNMFIMDYSSTLEDCKPAIGITVFNGDDILKVNEARKLWGIHEQLENTSNHFYQGTYKEFELTEYRENLEITIKIERT